MGVAVIQHLLQQVGPRPIDWNNLTIPLPSGVVVFEHETGAVKMGDGESLYAELPVLFNLNDIVNIMATLAGKAPMVHTHNIADVTGLQTALDGKAPSVHTHAIGNITNLQTTLDEKLTSSSAIQMSQLPASVQQTVVEGPAMSARLFFYISSIPGGV